MSTLKEVAVGKTVKVKKLTGCLLYTSGISDDSKYLSMDFERGKVYVSDVFADKYRLKKGCLLYTSFFC